MVKPPDTRVGTFLDSFFSSPNDVVAGPALEPWIQLLERGAPTVLPARSGGKLTFYGLSASPAAGRGLAEDLLACIGPSWSGFEGASAVLDPGDAVERAILTNGRVLLGGPTFRLSISEANESAAWAALERMRRAWARRPALRENDVLLAPLADVLRDVELALRTLALDEVTRLVQVLRRRGDLDSQNLLFLDLRLLAASGRLEEVLRHPRLDDVLNARRPVGVTAMLLQAVHAEFFAVPAANNDAQTALDIYRERVAGRFGRLVDSSTDLTSAVALQVRILAAVETGATDDQLGSLVELGDAGAVPWLASLAGLAGAQRSPDPAVVAPVVVPIQAARDALYAGQHGRVLELMADMPASAEAVDLMVNAAVALGTVQAAHVAAAAFGRLSQDDQGALRRHPILARPLEGVLAFSTGAEAVRSWADWLARLGEEEAFDQALPLAEIGAVEWPTTEPDSATAAEEFASSLTALPDRVRPTLERALPHLLEYFDRRPAPDEFALPVFGAVLEVLAYGESRTRAVREAALSVIDTLLYGTPGAALYDDLIDSIVVIWDDVRAARTMSWLTDVMALLVAHACPVPQRRLELMRATLADALAMRDLDRGDVDFLVFLARDPVFGTAFDAEAVALEGDLGVEAPDSSETSLKVGSLTVGIYTLSPASGRQAQAVLRRRFPNLEIELNHEKDGSPLLHAFARRADVLAVVIASAKHAATNALRAHCRPGTIVEVGTKGSTGLVRAVVARLEDLAAE